MAANVQNQLPKTARQRRGFQDKADRAVSSQLHSVVSQVASVRGFQFVQGSSVPARLRECWGIDERSAQGPFCLAPFDLLEIDPLRVQMRLLLVIHCLWKRDGL